MDAGCCEESGMRVLRVNQQHGPLFQAILTLGGNRSGQLPN